MGNKTSNELWVDIYRLQGKEMMGFGDEVTEKVQMGELDLGDEKALKRFEADFKRQIAEDRKALIQALWTAYSAKKATIGASECRTLVKEAIKEGKANLPNALVSYVEVLATKKCGKQLNPLMTDRESRPFVEASLGRIRKDCSDRVKNHLHELLSDSNFYAETFLTNIINGDPETKAAASSTSSTSTPAPAKTGPPSRAITPEKFAANFAYAHAILIQLSELLRSVEAQFTSFLEMELRNIPERVIKKLEADVEEAEAAGTNGASSTSSSSSSSTTPAKTAKKAAATNDDDSD